MVYLFMFNTSGIFKKINYYLLASFIFSSLFITIYAQQKNITISEIVDDNNYLYKFGPSFDTGDEEFYDVDHDDKLLLKEFTLSAWFNTNQTDFDNPAHIVNKGGFNSDNKGENMNYGIWLSPDGTLTGGFETDSGDDFQVVSDEKYNDGKWHFVILGYNGSVLLSNIDNKDINSLIVNEEHDINGEQPLRIGANSLNKDKVFDGRIDEVRVWSRGLTNHEINNIYKHNNYDSNGQIIYLNFGGNGTDSNHSSNLEGIKGEEGAKGENLFDLTKYSISSNVSNATSTAAKTTTTVLPTTNATSTAAKTTTTVLPTTNATSTAAKTTTTVLPTTNATSTAAKTTTTVLPTTNASSTAAKTTTTVLPTTNATSKATKTTTTVLPTTNATSTAAKTTTTVLPTTNATTETSKIEYYIFDKKYNIAVTGDWGCNNNTRLVVNYIQSSHPELVVTPGDLSYEETGECFYDLTKPISSKLKVALGNHDNEEDETKQIRYEYMKHFNLTRPFYSFNQGNIHFLMMDSSLAPSKMSAQFYFVQQDLEDASKNPNIKWIFVVIHKPLYTSSGKHPPDIQNTFLYHPLFDKYNVDIVFSGHNHWYERSLPLKFNYNNPISPWAVIPNSTSSNYIHQIAFEGKNGTLIDDEVNSTYRDPKHPIFVTVGTGGHRLYNIDELNVPKYMAKTYDYGFGFLGLNVTKNEVIGEFHGNHKDHSEKAVSKDSYLMKDSFRIVK